MIRETLSMWPLMEKPDGPISNQSEQRKLPLPSVSLQTNHYLRDLDLGLKEGDLRPSSTSSRLWLDSKSWCSKAALYGCCWSLTWAWPPDSLSWLLHRLDKALLPGVVPYPELLGREATDHLLPSPDLTTRGVLKSLDFLSI